jgi:hypothetical protein
MSATNVQQILLIAKPLTYYSPLDEDAFFAWLQSIPCVTTVRGVGPELEISIDVARLDEDGLRELIALFFRYGMDMKGLAQFANDGNRHWFLRKDMYWYEHVFV